MHWRGMKQNQGKSLVRLIGCDFWMDKLLLQMLGMNRCGGDRTQTWNETNRIFSSRCELSWTLADWCGSSNISMSHLNLTELISLSSFCANCFHFVTGLQYAWHILACSAARGAVSSACQTKLQVQYTQWIIHHLTLSRLVSNCFLFV